MDWKLPGGDETNATTQPKAKNSASGISLLAKNAAGAVNTTASMLGKHALGALEPFKKKLAGAEKERRKSSRIQVLDEKGSDADEGDEDAPQAKKPRLSKSSLMGGNSGPFRPKANQLGFKKYESTGLYVGQDRDMDPRYKAQKEGTKKAKTIYLEGTPSLPGPMFTGQRMLEVGSAQANQLSD